MPLSYPRCEIEGQSNSCNVQWDLPYSLVCIVASSTFGGRRDDSVHTEAQRFCSRPRNGRAKRRWNKLTHLSQSTLRATHASPPPFSFRVCARYSDMRRSLRAPWGCLESCCLHTDTVRDFIGYGRIRSTTLTHRAPQDLNCTKTSFCERVSAIGSRILVLTYLDNSAIPSSSHGRRLGWGQKCECPSNRDIQLTYLWRMIGGRHGEEMRANGEGARLAPELARVLIHCTI